MIICIKMYWKNLFTKVARIHRGIGPGFSASETSVLTTTPQTKIILRVICLNWLRTLNVINLRSRYILNFRINNPNYDTNMCIQYINRFMFLIFIQNLLYRLFSLRKLHSRHAIHISFFFLSLRRINYIQWNVVCLW